MQNVQFFYELKNCNNLLRPLSKDYQRLTIVAEAVVLKTAASQHSHSQNVRSQNYNFKNGLSQNNCNGNVLFKTVMTLIIVNDDICMMIIPQKFLNILLKI